MKHQIDIAARTLSLLLYPMLMPTYGMIMLCSIIDIPQHSLYPVSYLWLALCGSTFVITLLIPLLCIIGLKHAGVITDLHLEQKEQRLWPYLITIVCYIVWFHTFRTFLPQFDFLHWTMTGAVAALTAVTIINKFWKISAHLCAIGGLTGGMINGALSFGIQPTESLCAILTASLMLMYARIYLKAHDDKQVVAGFLLGLVCTALPYTIANA